MNTDRETGREGETDRETGGPGERAMKAKIKIHEDLALPVIPNGCEESCFNERSKDSSSLRSSE